MAYEPLTLQIPVSVCDIISIHYFEYLSDFSFPGEAHDFWELVYVDNGEFSAAADDKIIPLKKNSIIFHKPNEFHNVLTNGKVSPSLVVIGFVCHSPCMDAFQNQVLTLLENERALLARIIIEARSCFEGRLDDPYQEKLIRMETPFSFAGEELIRHYLEELIILLYRRNFFRPLPAGIQPASRPSNHTEAYNRIVLYMEEHINQTLTVKEICDANFISPPYLQKVFRETQQCGAIDFFLRLKLEAAKQMIREQQLNFSQIADRLGYSSVHYFSKQFKRFTGMSPSQYASSLKQMAERPDGVNRHTIP